MKITAIYGTMRTNKSSTYNIAQKFIKQLSNGDSVKEYFLPKNMPNFCRGCWLCFEDHTKCPDYDYLKPIVEDILDSDLIIFTAPVYVYHAPGQIKAFLDHFGYQWMPHRPRKEMFSKQALIISTAAGAGTKSTIKDIRDSLNYWGIAKIYAFGKNSYTYDWNGVSEKTMMVFQKEIDKISNKIKKDSKNVKPSLKVKVIFYVMRHMQKKMGFTEADVEYWKQNGWLDKERPW